MAPYFTTQKLIPEPKENTPSPVFNSSDFPPLPSPPSRRVSGKFNLEDLEKSIPETSKTSPDVPSPKAIPTGPKMLVNKKQAPTRRAIDPRDPQLGGARLQRLPEVAHRVSPPMPESNQKPKRAMWEKHEKPLAPVRTLWEHFLEQNVEKILPGRTDVSPNDAGTDNLAPTHHVAAPAEKDGMADGFGGQQAYQPAANGINTVTPYTTSPSSRQATPFMPHLSSVADVEQSYQALETRVRHGEGSARAFQAAEALVEGYTMSLATKLPDPFGKVSQEFLQAVRAQIIDTLRHEATVRWAVECPRGDAPLLVKQSRAVAYDLAFQAEEWLMERDVETLRKNGFAGNDMVKVVPQDISRNTTPGQPSPLTGKAHVPVIPGLRDHMLGDLDDKPKRKEWGQDLWGTKPSRGALPTVDRRPSTPATPKEDIGRVPLRLDPSQTVIKHSEGPTGYR